MSQYELRYHPETKTIWIKGSWDPEVPDTFMYGVVDLPDPVYPKSYVAYHKVRDALYLMSNTQVNVPGQWPNVITDMASINIKWASELPAAPFIWETNLNPTLSVTQTGTDPLYLRVSVSGGRGPYTYKWYKGATLLPEYTTNELLKADPVTGDTGSYKVEVVEDNGTVHTSVVCAVTVNP